MSVMTPTRTTSSIPRPSASLIIVNAQNQVLLVERNQTASSFAGVHVFPGGNYDPKQDDSLLTTAIRETFEESGILFARPSRTATAPSQFTESELYTWRHEVITQRSRFRDILEAEHLQLDVDSVLPFTSWVTPTAAPRRFHTRFYIVFLPMTKNLTPGHHPTTDGGIEIRSIHFMHPSEALLSFRQRNITLMPPQFYLLTTLAHLLEGSRNTHAQRERVAALASGAFGQMVVHPSPGPGPQPDKKGWTTLTFEGDEERGGPKGRLHRVWARITKGIPEEIVLHRNFDIFNDIKTDARLKDAKL